MSHANPFRPDFQLACEIVDAVADEASTAPPRPIDDATVRVLVAASLHEAGAGDGEQLEVSVTFADPESMRQINLEHREIDSATDVLSFPIDGLDVHLAPGEPRMVGDLVVCVPYVVEQLEAGITMLPHGPGQEHGDATLEAALERCIVHGTLHLAGFDHERSEQDALEMFALEQLVLDRVRGAASTGSTGPAGPTDTGMH